MAKKMKNAAKNSSETSHEGDKEHDPKAAFFGWFARWANAKSALAQIEEAAKAALGSKTLQDFRLRQKLHTEKGAKAVRHRTERTLEITQWLGLAIGSAEVDRAPLSETAYNAGELAGLNGDPCAPPHSL